MKIIKAIIVDDEPIARSNLAALIREDPEVKIAAECTNGIEAVRRIRKAPPDLLFLDVQMPGLDGFGVLEKIDVRSIPAIVFVTAYDQYAIRAFDVHAVDYLLKPFDDERFSVALERAKLQIRQRGAVELGEKLHSLLQDHREHERAGAGSREPTRFLIRESNRVFYVRADHVDWIEAADYYVTLHVGSKSHLLRETMAELEKELDASMFIRIHRSAIINVRCVQEVQTRIGGRYLVVLKSGVQLKLSRTRRQQLDDLLHRLS